MKFNSPEVLAPVGNKEMLIAAVRSGADAVYFGSKMFSARRNAENFDDAELYDAIRYCKIRGVKTYLALNIMIKQSELDFAIDTARTAHRAGIDAVIIQDLGLAKILHTAFPNLELHASTQMSLHSPSALGFLKQMGFSRVVASREMNEQQLIDFCKEADRLDMEVEVFVHGALCMSVSGQCLLSAILGGRSGNRGLCAGPCRLPFAAENGTGYDLSLKDLSLFGHIEKLKDMGVASLKIEGRMKRPEYVAAAVSACRQAVDNGLVLPDLSSALQGVFSRSGFTDGYFTSKTGKCMFGIRTKDDVTAAGDTFSALHEIYRAERQCIPVDITADIRMGASAKLTITDGINTATVSGETPQAAKNRALDKDAVKQSLAKLGSTPYFVRNFDVTLDDGLFLPNSALNELRRTATEKLSDMRAAIPEIVEREYVYHTDNKSHGGGELIARFSELTAIPDDLSELSAVILPIDVDIPDGLTDRVRVIAEIPRWIDNEEKIKARLDALYNKGITEAICSNLSAVSIAKNAGFKVMGGMGLNAANTESVSVLEVMGVQSLVLSPEILISELQRINTALDRGIFAYGRLPLMLFKNCPIKNGRGCADCDKRSRLTDRMGIEFPIECHVSFCELLNSKPHYLADRVGELSAFDFLLLYFTDESSDEVEKIISKYTKGAKPDTDYTRGLYYRNLE